MTPETLDYLAAAERALTNARNILAINIPDPAARLAYYAQFRAAQPLILERTAKISKTHKGVDRQFHKLVKAEPTLPPDLAGQLSEAYYFKDVADYDTGSAPAITPDLVRDAIATAGAFVSVIRRLLQSPP
jgi:uncharacterized protein (UPF0332 family)